MNVLETAWMRCENEFTDDEWVSLSFDDSAFSFGDNLTIGSICFPSEAHSISIIHQSSRAVCSSSAVSFDWRL
jgi:hypothetical protein